jgi:hypothetical protein
MDLKKYLPYYMRVWRGLSSYFLFVIVMALGSLLFRTSTQTVDPEIAEGLMPSVLRAIFIPFVFASIVRIPAERDIVMQRELYPGADNFEGFWHNVGAVLRCRYFWIETGVVLALGTILPAACGFYPLEDILFRHSALSPVIQGLFMRCIILPFFFITLLWQHTMALYRWYDMERRNQLCETERSPIGSLCLILPLYLLAFFALSFVLPVILTVYFAVWLLLIPLAAFLLFLLVWRYTRALRIRKRFLRLLRALCKKQGFILSDVKRPYRSIFRNKGDINFTIDAKGKRYACKMLAAVSYGTTLILSENGTAAIEHSLGLRQGGISAVRHGLFGIGANLSQASKNGAPGYYRHRKVELYRFTTHLDFSFDSADTKLLIVNPVPFEIMVGDTYRSRYIDNGDFAGEYLVFSASGLLGALERDCIERLADDMKLQLKD